jgi:hypothetical protein
MNGSIGYSFPIKAGYWLTRPLRTSLLRHILFDFSVFIIERFSPVSLSILMIGRIKVDFTLKNQFRL